MVQQVQSDFFQNLSAVLVMLECNTQNVDMLGQVTRALSKFPDYVAVETVKAAPAALKRRAMVSDFVDLACSIYGVTKGDLEDRGRVAFRELIGLSTPCYDLITDDWRLVYAVKHGWGSLKRFFDKVGGVEFRERDFISAYARKPYMLEHTAEHEYYLQGFQNILGNGERLVNFIGDYETCRNILCQRSDAKLFRLPLAPWVPPVEKIELSEEAAQELRANSIVVLDNAIAELKQGYNLG